MMQSNINSNSLILRIENLSFCKSGKEILKNISCEINANNTPLVIFGQSGSGKSSFLRAATFIENPTSGNIFLDGVHIQTAKKTMQYFRENVGVIFQEAGLFPNMTVLKNICYAAIKSSTKKAKEAIKEKAMQLLCEFGLANYADALPHQLSGGEKQRVAIIRALILEPKILFFDEPTSALDYENIDKFTKIVSDLNEQNILTVIITHDTLFARNVGKEFWEFSNGKIENHFNIEEYSQKLC